MTRRSAAASSKTTTGTRRRSLGARADGASCLISSLCESTAAGLTSGDFTASAIFVSSLLVSLFFAEGLFKVCFCRPVSQQGLLILVIGFREVCLGLQAVRQECCRQPVLVRV